MEGLFTLLAACDQEAGIRYILERHVHTVNTDSRLQLMRAAHRALLRFETRPGTLRHEVVERFIIVYAALESREENTQPLGIGPRQKAWWHLIRDDVIRVLQAFSQSTSQVSAARGAPFERVREFQMWFRRHKDRNAAPWRDPK